MVMVQNCQILSLLVDIDSGAEIALSELRYS